MLHGAGLRENPEESDVSTVVHGTESFYLYVDLKSGLRYGAIPGPTTSRGLESVLAPA